MMKIYTKAGDSGAAALFGGQRISKSAARLHAYGTIDELSSLLGLILCEEIKDPLKKQIKDIQSFLFLLSTDLATPLESKAPIIRIGQEEALLLEKWIDEYDLTLRPLTTFIASGGTRLASLLHLARTVCRRAERWIVSLQEEEAINEHCLITINRLSDYLFTAARVANHQQGVNDEEIVIRTRKD
jgi:cob(I)alamin adenosyltransferase